MGTKRVVKGDDMAAAATGGVDAEEPLVASASQNATVEELRDMFHAHMKMQQEREKRVDQETARQEIRWKALQHQFTLLQEEVHTRTTPTTVHPSGLQYTPSNQGSEQADARGSPFVFNLEAELGKTRKSRSQRRCEKYRHAVVSEREPGLENPLGYKVPSDIVELQKKDSIVGPLYKMVEKRTLAGQTEVRVIGINEYELKKVGASQYPPSFPRSSILHPMTRKPIELSHLEGHLNSLIALQGGEDRGVRRLPEES
ncbi:hypothetical protein DPX16_17334 [Anabarilius grahami]|uniref:Uncharacterized protein n=1 Tax=Anabarilius grahami TaxID=495550 RepID=A0A3N0XZ13_ANAGA|nr:hypothetical protein DPX16_17334 [Anabarilius grahami]